MVDHGILRGGFAAGLFLLGTVARPTAAQHLDAPIFSGSLTVTQPLTSGVPGDVAGRILVDPSTRALAPWAAFGVRWAGLLERAAQPTGSVGVRYRRRSFRVALGLSRDVAYSSLAQQGERPNPQDSSASSLSAGDRPTVMTPALTSTGRSVPGYTTLPVTDVVGSAEWSVGPIALGLESGLRLAGPGRRQPWLGASIAAPLVDRLGLVAGVDHWRDRTFAHNAPRVTLGLAWRSTPWGRPRPKAPVAASGALATDSGALTTPKAEAVFAVDRQADGIRLRFLAPKADQVEIRSNLTGWMPTPLERATDGAWHVALAATSGVHRVALRVDGGPWLPPPGLPVGSDGYGASVGVFILEP